MKNYIILIIGLLAVLPVFSGCDKEPMNKLVNPLQSNTTGNWSGVWTLYDDEVKTGGDIMNYTTHEGVGLQFDCRDNPHSGSQCIKFSWDGGDVTNYEDGKAEHDWTGFGMIVASSYLDYTKYTKNLATGGFTKLSFWVRGSLNSNVYLRLEGSNARYNDQSGTNCWQSYTTTRKVTSTWTKYEFPISGDLTAVKDYLRVIFRYDMDYNADTPNTGRSNGGTIYLDDIALSR